MIVYIFGSGSIACRHSVILNKFSDEIICVSSFHSDLKNIFHNNKFTKIISPQHVLISNEAIYIIATNTSLHTQICKDLIYHGVDKSNIFCEKPGPSEYLGVNVLYNLKFLNLPSDLGNPIRFVHKSDSKSWPSDLHWKKRYIFRKKLGGGVFKTHSHELIAAFDSQNPGPIIYSKRRFYTDIDDLNINISSEFTLKNINFDLCLDSLNPIRFWEFENMIIYFYGNKKNMLKKTIFNIDVKNINLSYESMWNNLLHNKTFVALSYDFSWVNNYE